jgi:hypothetical protein
MNRTIRSVVLLMLGCTVVWLNTSALAQSLDASAPELERTSSAVVREYVPARLVSVEVPLPPNILVPNVYRNLVEVMLRRSATFRRQCVRIAAEPRLKVVVEMSPQSFGPGIRAITRIRRTSSGSLAAEIQINSADDEVELLSHELEHVIEQLDQIDLRSKAAQSGSGVHKMVLDTALFETTRATRTGLRAALEMRGGARRAD